MQTTVAAQGRWREILIALGVPTSFLTGKHGPCLLCGGTDRARFTDTQGDGDYLCSQCGARKGVNLLMHWRGWTYAEAFREVDQIMGNLPLTPRPRPTDPRPCTVDTGMLRRLWQAGRPIQADDPAGRFLRARGIDLDRAPLDALRFVPRLQHYPSNSTHPGMIACVRCAEGRAVQMHRTYLTDAGGKAPVEPVRMIMPGPVPKGAAIRLGPAGPCLGVAEGIETALAAAQLFGGPVWATLFAHLLESWQPPPEAETITIYGDADSNFVGQVAAYQLAKRLHLTAERAKIARVVDVRLPLHLDRDFNDVLLGRSCAPGSQTQGRTA